MRSGGGEPEIIIRLTCPDRVGIVFAVAGFLAQRRLNIVESQQFADQGSDRFFMRVQASATRPTDIDAVRREFAELADAFDMTWEIHDAQVKPRILVLVSQLGHCLNDLLYRSRVGALNAEIAGVVSNHREFEALTLAQNIPFHYLPVSTETRAEQESALLAIVADSGVELVVLARYMQILSEGLVRALEGRAINIHHSFLPSFKGARPYHQAHAHGVKLIGATAHYVTAVLDEGPIIEQEVARVDHTHSPGQLAAVGRDLECVALARAVGWHLERRVMLNDQTTVVFR